MMLTSIFRYFDQTTFETTNYNNESNYVKKLILYLLSEQVYVSSSIYVKYSRYITVIFK